MTEWHLPPCLKKNEQKKSSKKKEITCFRCKKVGHYASECNKELPAKTPKSGTNMLIMDEDSSHDENSDLDDDDGQYKEKGDDEGPGYDDDEDDKPPKTSQETTQNSDNAGTECDNDTTDDDSEQGKEYNGQFDDDDFEGIVFAQKDVLCNVQEKAGILKTWILLDSQSTVDVFCNARLLNNVRDAKRQLVLHCNAGTTIITKKGDLKKKGDLLSLSNVSKIYRVTYDSDNKDEQGLVVHKEDGSK